MFVLDNKDAKDRRTPLAFEIGSDIGDNKAAGGGFIGTVPASFATQMGFASDAMRAKRASADESDDQQRIAKLMLARMNNLEESFRDMLQEVKEWRRNENRSPEDSKLEGRTGRKPARKSPRRQDRRIEKAEKDGGDEWVDEKEQPKGKKAV